MKKNEIVEPTFDELMFEPVAYDDVRHNYMPKHLSRRDLRRWERARRWGRIDEFDRQLAIGGIVAGALVTFLLVVAIVAELAVG